MKKDCLRIFIAVKIGDEVKKELTSALIELRRLPFSIKWVEPENLHLTLAFLGDLEAGRLPGLYRAVEKSRVGIPSFNVQPTKIVCFPNLDRPRVIALELKGEVFWLTKLQQALKENLGQEKFVCRIKPAHLTLGRVRARTGKKDGRQLGKRLVGVSWSFQKEILVDRVTVFQSELLTRGPRYTPLKEFKLS